MFELMHQCTDLAVPREVMQHVVRVESSFNPYAIGVVGGRLARQPRTLDEAVATARMLERRGYNFSLGLAQVNRYNLSRQGLASYAQAFQPCPNLQAGSRILAECHSRSKGSWGRAFSCYYSGNFVTGYRHGYVQKVFASMQASAPATSSGAGAIEVIENRRAPRRVATPAAPSRIAARVQPVSRVEPLEAARTPVPAAAAQAPAGEVAVLNPGAAPTLMKPNADAPAPQPVTTTPTDTAFVF